MVFAEGDGAGQLPARLPAARTVVLVEGISDLIALQTLAERRGRRLAAQGVHIAAMGGATNIRRFLGGLDPARTGIRLAGMYDAAEEGYFRRALEACGIGPDLEAHGFFACVADLEDELIRAIGPATVERVIAAQGELPALRLLQRQPAQRGRSPQQQLRRFVGTRAGRKARYARALVEALDPTRVPRPLEGVLAHV